MSEGKRKVLLAAAVAGLAVAGLVAIGSSKIGKAAGTGLNLVYVNGNITGTNMNAVYAYSNDGAGHLTALAGSPYLTDGAGVGTGGGSDHQWDADQEIIANPEGTLMFAVNAHSNTVAAFTVNTDGTLTTVPSSPFTSGGSEPISMAFKDNALGGGNSLMVVVNKDSDPAQTGGIPSYTTFTVSSAGVMTPNANSTYNLPAGSSPAQAIMFPSQNKFLGLEFLNGTLSSYSLSHAGKINKIASATPPFTPPYIVGGTLNPKFQSTIYLGLPGANEVAAYTYTSAGALTFVKGVADMGQAICWLTANKAGTRLYTAETASGTMTVWNVTAPAKPTQLQHVSLAKVNGVNALPTSMSFDTTGNFLYVVDRSGAIHVLNVASDGGVSEPSAPVAMAGLPAGTVPLGVVVLAK